MYQDLTAKGLRVIDGEAKTFKEQNGKLIETNKENALTAFTTDLENNANILRNAKASIEDSVISKELGTKLQATMTTINNLIKFDLPTEEKINDLVKKGVLKKHGVTKNAYYVMRK